MSSPATWSSRLHTLHRETDKLSQDKNEFTSPLILDVREIKKLQGLPGLAEAWLSPSSVPSSIWSFWALFSGTVSQHIPTLRVQPLQEMAGALSRQVESGDYLSQEWIEKSLSGSSSFFWVLPSGESFENVVHYVRESEGTWTISLFHAASGIFRTQGGDYSVEGESASPACVYKEVPEKELKGAHVTSVLRAIKKKGKVESAYLPLRAYQVPYSSQMEMLHAQGMKGVNAWIASFHEKEVYKALQVLARLHLIEGLVQAKQEQFIPLLRDTARYVEKQQENRYLLPLIPSIVSYLEGIHQLEKKVLYTPFPSPQQVIGEKLALDQQKLVEAAIGTHPYRPLPLPKQTFALPPGSLPPFSLQTDQKTWRLRLERRKTSTDPALFLVELEEIIASLPLEWTTVRAEHLQTLVLLSEAYTEAAFQSKRRFSLQTQNRGFHLLISSYALAVAGEKKGVLASFPPPIKGYQELAHHPYFSWSSWSEWEERQKLLERANRFEQGRKKENDFFSKSFCQAICRAYPLLKEETAWLALLHVKTSEGGAASLPPQDPSLLALSSFLQIAMHIQLLSDPTARAQRGHETIMEGRAFSLRYAENGHRPLHFLINGTPLEAKEHRNLMPEEALLEKENGTLARTMGNSQENRAVEWSACQPALMVSSLLEWMQSHHTYSAELERYLFKVVVDAKGKERIPLVEEMRNHPHLFTKRVLDVLDSCHEATPLAIRLYSLAKELAFQPLIEALSYRLSKQKKGLLLELLLCDEKNWEDRLRYMGQLATLEEEGADVSREESLRWHRYRGHAIRCFQQLPPGEAALYLNRYLNINVEWELNDFPLCREKQTGKIFDLFHFRYVNDRREVLPEVLRTHPEFIRIFGENIRYGMHKGGGIYEVKIGEETVTFSGIEFPSRVVRTDSQYIPYNEVEKGLSIPKVIAHEAHWWRFSNGKVIGYAREGFLTPLFHTQKEGFLVSNETGLWIERVGVDSFSQHPAFEHYVTYHPRQLIASNFRDEVHFPALGVRLIRQGREFVWARDPHYLWVDTLFQSTPDETALPSRCGTPLKIQGVVLQDKRVQLTGSNRLLLLPLTRYRSEPHTHVVHPIGPSLTAALPSLKGMYERIQLEISKDHLAANTPKEHLFAAYLSLVGKDYDACLRFLKGIRPHHHLDAKEREILRWIIDSREDAGDASSNGAVLRLRAFRLFVSHVLPLAQSLKEEEYPTASLEETYLLYLRHQQEVPPLLRLSLSFKQWILGKGFAVFPPKKENEEKWERHKKEERAVEVVVISPLQGSLMERWKNKSEEGLYIPLKVNEQLVRGIEEPREIPLVPGLPYPLEAFGFHYHRLCTGTEEEQRELVYEIETTPIPTPLRRALQNPHAPLPDFSSATWRDKRHLFKEWIKPFSSISSAPLPQVEQREKRASRLNQGDPIKQLKPFIWQENVSSEELYRSYQEEYPPAIQRPPISLSSPFEGEPPSTISKETWEAYQKEWERGLQEWNAAPFFPLPSLQKVGRLSSRQMERENQLWDERIRKIQMDLHRHLNQRPTGSLNGTLQEVAHHKLEIHPDDIKSMILLSSPEEKLCFLQRRNPFLQTENLPLIEQHLELYLLFANFKQMLLRVEEKADQILQKGLEDSAMRKDPTCIHLWQEISRLFHPHEGHLSSEERLQDRLQAHLFEQVSGFRLRKDQVELFHQLVQKILVNEGEERGEALVFQAMMGGGKTSVILARLSKLAASEGLVPLFMAHHSQYEPARGVLLNSQYRRHRQDVVDLDFSREELGSLTVLEHIREQLNLAKQKKRLLFMKTNFLLMLELEFLDQLNNWATSSLSDPSIKKRTQLLASLLIFIKKECLLIGDEADINLQIMQGVNYADGAPIPIRPETIDLVKTVYRYLAEEKKLRLSENKQTHVSPAWIKESVLPRLIEKMLDEYPPLSELLTPPNWEVKKGQLKAYILGGGEFTEASSAASLLRELCEEVLPIVLAKGFNRHYGFNEEGVPIHYLGVDAPSPNEFGNIYEAACHFFQGALNQKVTVNWLNFYRKQLQEAAHYYADLYHCPAHETAEAHHFLGITTLPLFDEWSDQEVEQALNELNQCPERILDFYGEMAPLVLHYHRRILECSPAALYYMGKQFIGCAGVLWNRETFSRPIARGSEIQEGIEGKVMVQLMANVLGQKSALHSIQECTATALLDITQKRNTRAVIEVAGLLDAFSNQEIAEQVQAHPLLKDQVDGEVFFQGDGFALLRRGEQVEIKLKTASREEINDLGIPVDRLFVYYDELRTTGSHFDLMADGTAILTFNPHSTTLRGVLQGLLRMRGFFLGQQVDIAILREKMALAQLFVKALENQEKQLNVQLLRSAIEQVKEVYRSSVLWKLILQIFQDEEGSLKLYQACEELFYLFFTDDPLSLFLHPQEEVEGWKLVEREKERIEKLIAPLLSTEEKRPLLKEAEGILEWAKGILKEKVRASSMPTQVHVQKQKNKEVERQKEVAREVRKYQVRVDAPPAIEWEWKKKKEKPTSYKDYEEPPSLPFFEFMKRITYDAPYETIFPLDLVMTENLSRTFTVDLPVFHPAQKRCSHFLLIKEEGTYRTLFIDYTEAAFWREEIQGEKLTDVWLADLDALSLHDTHPFPEEAKPVVNRAAWWGHFYNGDVAKLRRQPTLVQTELRDQHHTCKIHFLKTRTVDHPEELNILLMDPLLNDHPEKAPVFTFASREEEEKWKDKELSTLQEEELNHLPFHFVRFLSAEQIRALKRRGYFFYLPSERFDVISPAQVTLLSSSLLRHLKTQEQVAVVPKEKVRFLKGTCLQFLAATHIEQMDPDELIHLTPLQQKLYQEKMIEKSSKEAFLQRVTPRMAPAILPCYVEDLPDALLSYLTKKEQLAAVAVSRYRYLAARQFHLLPQEKWKELTLADIRRYAIEKEIPREAKPFIQELPLAWIEELDSRLIPLFSPPQLLNISLNRLTIELCSLFDQTHQSLIERITHLDHLKALSPKGRLALSEKQLLRLVQAGVELPPPLIQRLSLHSLQQLPLDLQCTLIPHLSHPLLEALLQGEGKGRMLAVITKAQWQSMRGAFIHSYFNRKPKSLIDYVPLSRIKELPNHALLIRLDRDLPLRRLQDLFIGLLATLFYPLVLLLSLFGGKKWALAPLRLFHTAAWYRRCFTIKEK